MDIVVLNKGNWRNTTRFLMNIQNISVVDILNRYGEIGVTALATNTPKDSSLTANSWSYDISSEDGGYILSWTNSNIIDSVPIAILLQYGHGTKNGGYVQGSDYINPALADIFDTIADEIWNEVKRL